jgi:guanine deaminase
VSAAPEIVRGFVCHTPRNPFREEKALEAYSDGALAIADGRILAAGDYAKVRAAYPSATVEDWRGSVVLPGLVDAHVHFPQTRIIGRLGLPLLDWLRFHAIPEEERMADPAYADIVASEFVRALASHGTTTALVFGAHFAGATEALFRSACAAGLRISSGLVLSDRFLPESLRQTPEEAYRSSRELMTRYHGHELLRYAVTPRFALSASEAMLEVCAALLRDEPGAVFQTHINENPQEVAEVRAAFPWAEHYLGVYDRFGLAGARSVFAHNVHTTDAELARLADAGAAVAHCPCSNAMLGGGIFPMQRHIAAGVRFGLGTDVGAGTGFGILKEALAAYMMQRVLPDGVPLSAAHLLYMATRGGAEALGLEEETGDFAPGKSADFVRIEPGEGTPLAGALQVAGSEEQALAAVITQSAAEAVREVRVGGKVVPLEVSSAAGE